MNFYEFYRLLNENTISQELKKIKQSLFFKSVIEEIHLEIKKYVDESLIGLNINEKNKNMLVNWVLFSYIKKWKEKHDDWNTHADYPNDNTTRNTRLLGIKLQLKYFLEAINIFLHSDYFAYNLDNSGNFNPLLASKFNNPNFTHEDLLQLNLQYHNDLKKGNIRIPGKTGKIVLEFSDGYKWVDLEKGKCEIEGKAGNHCGNAAARPGDTILSLRDNRNLVHLTFILNNGVLVERKARGNNKPIEKYHKYIVELLKLPIIEGIGLGRYLPEKDFKLYDLTKEQLKEIFKIKPKMEEDYYLQNLKDDKEIPLDVLNKLLERKNFEINKLIAKNEKTPTETITKLFDIYENWHDEEEKFTMLIEIAGNPNTRKYIITELFKKYYNLHPTNDKYYRIFYEDLLNGLAGNPNTPTEILTIIANERGGDLVYHVSINPSTPKQVLLDLFNKNRNAVLGNPNIPEELLRKVVNSERNPPVTTDRGGSNAQTNRLMWIASNESCPPDLLEKLSTDQEYNIRQRVAFNKSTPIKLLKKMAAEDSEEAVRSVAEQQLQRRV